jgi:hypothetical protein
MTNSEAQSLMRNHPVTAAVGHALRKMNDKRAIADLLFLETWEMCPLPGSAYALRISQIRRANPDLVLAIRRELAAGRSLPRRLPQTENAARRPGGP